MQLHGFLGGESVRIMCYTDVHFSQYSSVLRERGERYSLRLENIIKSLNWAEKLALDSGCDAIFCLGDFFDKPELNAEEITALREIAWVNLPHFFLVGNHESNINSLEYSSTNSLSNLPNFHVINEPTTMDFNLEFNIVCLPYIVESNRLPIKDYLPKTNKKNLIFSHNDIKGIRYGKFESKEGFELEDIENNCSMFLNGHLHNGQFVNDSQTILNLGNLTGQNFSEDAFLYSHNACILTIEDDIEMKFYENPYALNFYKLELREDNLNCLRTLKDNSIVTIRCEDSLVARVREAINEVPSILAHRVIVYKEEGKEHVELTSLRKEDHLEQFYNFILNNLGTDDVVLKELAKIMG